MKNIITFCLLLVVNSVIGQYNQSEIDAEKTKEEIIFPSLPFDSLAAKLALSKGNSTVKGVASTRQKSNMAIGGYTGPRIYGNQMNVDLFPMTPYFEEWYNLKQKVEDLKGKKKKIVYMSTEAYSYRLYCTTNSKGRFTFPNLKPGKYILFGNLSFDKTYAVDNYSGSSYGNYGGVVNHYERNYKVVTRSNTLFEIVEVKKDGSVVKVKLK